MTRGQKRTLGRIIGALALFAIGLALGGDRCGGWLKAGFMLAAWLLAGYDVLWDAIRGILRGYGGAILSVSHDRKYLLEVTETLYRQTPEGLRREW